MTRKNQPAPVSMTRWVLTVVVVLGFSFALYSLTQVQPKMREQQSSVPVAGQENPASTRKEAKQASAEPDPGPQDEFYEFYKLLPESEVVAPTVAEYSSQARGKKARYHQFLLQAGSFRNKYDADRLRAKLILEGLETRVQPVQSLNGTTWHRVMVGPFSSRSRMNHAQDLLAAANTESLVIPVR